jgi:hypothetical protein
MQRNSFGELACHIERARMPPREILSSHTTLVETGPSASVRSETLTACFPRSREIERTESMRLEAIEKPKGLMMRIAYWMTRRQFGKVMTLMTLEIARRRGSLRLTYEIGKFELKRSGSNVASETPLWRLASSTNREQVCKGSRSNICDRLFSSCDSMGNRLFYILDSGWTKSLYYLWA